ncbi:ABC transporter ATP-binding protein [Pimelobacter simplex]|uniref:ABC transporter ATP-binding protein n=1 Tax=Nocardioides simplex TaxID=2045 RepID=UPI003819FA85
MASDRDVDAVELVDLAVRFSEGRHVGPVTLQLPSGSLLGVVGANGSGKTTILRALCGLVRHSGSVSVLGERVRFGRMPVSLGAMVERPAFIEHGTARFNLEALRRRQDRQRVDLDELLDMAGLLEHAEVRVDEYSHGMRQRLAIARTFLRRPSILILDEPANALDPHGHRWLRNLLRTFVADGGTAILASHVLHEVDELASHLLLLHEGSMLKFGEADRLVAGAGSLEDLFFDLVPERSQLGRPGGSR